MRGEHGEDTHRRARGRHVPTAGGAPRPSWKRRRCPRSRLCTLGRGGARDLLLLSAPAAHGRGARGGHQGHEGLARELLLLVARRAIPATHRETDTATKPQKRDAEEVGASFTLNED